MYSPKIGFINFSKLKSLCNIIIFSFGMGEGEKDKNKKLDQTGIPIAIILDHLESSPLARAEWIKFFAAFVNKKELADSLFNKIEKNYLELKKIAKNSSYKPSVFTEIKYSDAWYVPGGNSYVAELIKDANANYIWANDINTGSFPLSFEQVFSKANKAEFWINLSNIKTKKELLGFEDRYREFNAFKVGNLYNNNKNTNALGYSKYWETGMIYPNKILNDLILIFHPELINSISNTQIVCTPPSQSAGNVTMTIHTSYGSTSSNFTYIAPPIITSIRTIKTAANNYRA